MSKPGHPAKCGPYCAIQHCKCGRPAAHGSSVCNHPACLVNARPGSA